MKPLHRGRNGICRKPLTVTLLILFGALQLYPLLQTHLNSHSTEPVEGCPPGPSCLPDPLRVQVVDEYSIVIPARNGAIRISLRSILGQARLTLIEDNKPVFTEHLDHKSTAEIIYPMKPGGNYTLTVRNTDKTPILVEISVWYQTRT